MPMQRDSEYFRILFLILILPLTEKKWHLSMNDVKAIPTFPPKPTNFVFSVIPISQMFTLFRFVITC